MRSNWYSRISPLATGVRTDRTFGARPAVPSLIMGLIVAEGRSP